MPRRQPTFRFRPTVARLEERAVPATYTWTGGGGAFNTWSNEDNWESGLVPGSIANDTDIRVFFGAGTSGISVQNISGLTLGSVISLSSNAITLRLDEATTIDGADGSTSFDLGTGNTGILQIDGPRRLTLKDTVDIKSDTGATQIAVGLIGSGGIRKTGSGTLKLSGSVGNTYTGETRVSQGLMMLQTTTSDQGLSSNVFVGDGNGSADSAILQLTTPDEIPDSAAVTILSDGRLHLLPAATEAITTLDITDGEVLTSNGSVVRIRPDGTVRSGLGVTGSEIQGDGRIVLEGGTVTFDTATPAPDVLEVSDLTIRVPIVESAATGIRKTGSGTLSLTTSHANEYTGSTVIVDGILRIATHTIHAAVSPVIEIGDGTGNSRSAELRVEVGEELPVGDQFRVTVRGDGLLSLGENVDKSDLRDLTLADGGDVSLGLNSHLGFSPDAVVRVTGTAGEAEFDGSGVIAPLGTLVVDVVDGATLRVATAVVKSDEPSAELIKRGEGVLSIEGVFARSTDVPITVNEGTVDVGTRIRSALTAAIDGLVTSSLVVGEVGAESVRINAGGGLAPRAGLNAEIQADTNSAFLANSLTLQTDAIYFPYVTSGTSGGYTVPTRVSGAISLGGATLSVARVGSTVPQVGETYRIIDNTGMGAVSGTFASAPEGGTVTGDTGETYRISYTGGDGNDVVLSLLTLPTSPPTSPPASPPTSPPANPPMTPPAAVGSPVAAIGGTLDGATRRITRGDTSSNLGDPVPAFAGLGANVRVATADVNGDGVLDLIGGTGPGVATQVKVIDGATGSVVATLNPFEAAFTGGLFVAAADIDGDGKAEVVVAPDQGGGPVIAVYGGAGLVAGSGDAAQLTRFLGIEDSGFRGGARPALGDVNGDHKADLVVSAGILGGPRIAVFDGATVLTPVTSTTLPPKLIGDFFAFENELRNGAFVAAGDFTGDGKADIAFGGGPGGAPRVRLFNGAALLAAGSFNNLDEIPAAQAANFFAGGPDPRGGVRLGLRDTNGDGRADLLAGSGEGEAGRVRVYLSANLLANTAPNPDQEFDLGAVLANGVFVG